jgi:2-polyprenyl-3-methyl-5-hydroxy-6-metoxy-1,4-benzoquinol methylase
MKTYTVSTLNYYNSNPKNYFDRTINIDMQPSYLRFLKWLPQNTKILDAGCGVGRDSAYFIDKGFHVTALDASEEMVKLAQLRVNTPVLHKDFFTMNFNSEFDGVWTCASLLHISKPDLPNIFQKFTNALKTGGVWFISFKYGDVETIENGRLFSRFTISSFVEFAKQFPQLELLEIWRSASYEQGSENQWLQAVARKI